MFKEAAPNESAAGTLFLINGAHARITCYQKMIERGNQFPNCARA